MTSTGKQQAEVMSAIAMYCRDHHIAPLDRGLRSIVVQQTRNLLTGGWTVEEITPVAIEFASRYTRFDGHKALLGLQRAIEVADEDLSVEAHLARVEDERAPMDPRVESIVRAGRARRDLHPSRHAFLHNGEHCACTDPAEPEHPSCAVCRGPEGVHRRLVGVDENDRAVVVPTGVVR